ncbi:hypothetical protein AK812_SmicGene11780 [Symbiodinium microadriaticum]|uniref:Uncharacterized protein n=1 Tax=Symbiodinium microadriaticum TaxID=2951 RepID=A0A1Q9ECD9_SYMMI|nr:hypothetical protein AK812_SmicGene11780 [Symbiodinium microadriaticum]
MTAAMTPEVWDQLKHLREDRDKLKEAAESALQDGDEGGFEFQNMLASEITEKIEELEGKYGSQPPLPGARNEGPVQVGAKLPLPPPPPAPVASVALAKLPGMPGALPGVGSLPPGLAATIPPGVAANLPPGITANIPPGVASALGKMPPVPGAPPMPGLAPGFAGVRPPPIPLPPGMMPPLLGQPVSLTQQQAMEYEETKARDTALEPEVIELVHYFKISDRHARMLNEQLKRRNNTYEEDIASLYEILKGAKNPGDLLMVSIRWMEKGVFRGTLTPNPAVEKAAKKYKLDAPSACKLAEVLECREDPDADLRKISEHLAASNKPSSLVMQMLRDIKAGKPVEACTRAPAIGSYLHKKETATKQNSKGGRSRTPTRRSPSRERRHRSRERPRGRSRSRGGRGGERGGDRGAHRGDRGDRGGPEENGRGRQRSRSRTDRRGGRREDRAVEEHPGEAA